MTLVRLTWTDASDHNETWASAEEAAAFSAAPSLIRSAGFLVSKTDKYVTLGGDWDETDQNWGRLTKIPAGMVKELRTVYEGD
mgnify:FL=1